jgi:hypothetical protein
LLFVIVKIMKWALVYLVINAVTGDVTFAPTTWIYDSEAECHGKLFAIHEDSPSSTFKRDNMDKLTLTNVVDGRYEVQACTFTNLFSN